MYAWIWRRLPFGLPGKLAGSVLLSAAVVALLWYVVFPWAEPLLPFDDVQVTQDSGNPNDAPVYGDPNDPYSGESVDPSANPDDFEIPYDTDEPESPAPLPS